MGKTFRIIGIILVLMCCAGAGLALASDLGKDRSKGPGILGSSTAKPKNTHTITLDVIGHGEAPSISYSLGLDIAQENGADLPWHREIPWNGIAAPTIGITAQAGPTAGEIQCRITYDGKILKENKSTGQYALVTCLA